MKFSPQSVGILVAYMMVGAGVITLSLIHRRFTR